MKNFKYILLALIMFSFTGGVAMSLEKNKAEAIFAGGCFWCMEPPYSFIDGGVEDVSSGYTGGHVDNPTYNQVSAGTTGHYEAIRIVYDPAKVNYEKLLDIFWQNIDPTETVVSLQTEGHNTSRQYSIQTTSKKRLLKNP